MLNKFWQFLKALGAIAGLLTLMWNIYSWKQNAKPLLTVSFNDLDTTRGLIDFDVANLGRGQTTITQVEIAPWPTGRPGNPIQQTTLSSCLQAPRLTKSPWVPVRGSL